jgi:signal transduction histidine kinase
MSLCGNGSVDAQTSARKFIKDTAWFWNGVRAAERQSNHDSAMLILAAMVKQGISEGNDWKCNTALLKMGELYRRIGNYADALYYTRRAIYYSIALPLNEKSNVYEHVGEIYLDMGDYVNASENYYTALDFLEKDSLAWPNRVTVYTCLGNIYCRLHQYDKALSYYDQGEAYASKNNWTNCLAFVLYGKGEYYSDIHQLDSARKYYLRVKDIGSEIDRKDIYAIAMTGMGKTFIESGDYKTAVKYLQTAVDMTRDKDKSDWMQASFSLGKALYGTRNYAQSEGVLLDALHDSASTRLKDNKIDGYTTLSAVYRASGQYARALDCADSISVLKDALVSAENTRAINLMEINFQTAEKDKQIAQQNSKIAHKNLWILAVGAGTVLLLLLLTGSYFYTVAKQRSQEKENRIQVLNATIAGGESERSRIARELHDGIGGMLSAAMMRFSSLHHDDPNITSSEAYQDTMNMLREMGDEIRKTAHNLMPDILLKQSLTEALRTFCASLQQGSTLNVSFQCFGSFDGIDQFLKLNLYRITQELVHNAALHAHASAVLVQLLQNDDRMILSVEDNGVGFNMNEVKKGLGLANVQTRTDSMGGHLTLESAPGKGTTVIIEFKITDNPASSIAAQPYLPSLTA